MASRRSDELRVVQHAYDLILWEVPLITRFPVPYRAVLGDRMQTTLYTVLEKLIEAAAGIAPARSVRLRRPPPSGRILRDKAKRRTVG